MNLLLNNIKQLATINTDGKNIKIGKELCDIGIIENATILIKDGVFAWIGKSEDFNLTVEENIDVIDAEDFIALPGFVDCCVRSLLLKDISNKRECKKTANNIINNMLKHGTCSLEFKYCYDNENNMQKIFEITNELVKESLPNLIPTFDLNPLDNKIDKNEYSDKLCNNIIPYIAKKSYAKYLELNLDVDCFTAEQLLDIIKIAKENSLLIKIKSEKYSSIKALSSFNNIASVCSLLDQPNEDLNSVVILHPLDTITNNNKYSFVRKMIDLKVPVAIATNYNFLESSSFSIPLMMTMACLNMGLSYEEALSASTINAAAALGIADKVGSIELGKQADLILYKVNDIKTIINQYGIDFEKKIIKRGTYLDF